MPLGCSEAIISCDIKAVARIWDRKPFACNRTSRIYRLLVGQWTHYNRFYHSSTLARPQPFQDIFAVPLKTCVICDDYTGITLVSHLVRVVGKALLLFALP